MSYWITLLIVALTYFGIAVGRWPKTKSNRATVAMMGVVTLDAQTGWLKLAAASTLAGNLTLLGSVANLLWLKSPRGGGLS